MSIFRAAPFTLISAQTLTASYVDSQPISVEGYSDMLVCFTYTTGAAETNNELTIQVKSASGQRSTTTGLEVENDLYIQTVGTEASGVITLTDANYKFVGASAATAYPRFFTLGLQDKFVILSVKEVGVAANFGTLTVKIILVNKYQ